MDDHSGHVGTVEESAVTTSAELLSLKDGGVFLVADSQGDIVGAADGMFDNDTRILSQFVFLVGDVKPAPLSHGLSKDNAVFTCHGANRTLPPVGERNTPRGVVHIERKRTLWRGRMFERIRCTNFGLDEVMLPISFDYAADFADMFEVRGVKRPARGQLFPTDTDGRRAVFGYQGLDGETRRSALVFSEPPWRMTTHRADFMFSLPSEGRLDLHIEAGQLVDEVPSAERFAAAVSGARRAIVERRRRGAGLVCSDHAFAAWIEQSRADISLLTTDLETGAYPFAGIPWFSTPFGRDGILTSWQMLWLDPSLAKGVLTYLAKRQATAMSRFQDSEPGKIMHETRKGEMAALGEVPFGLYYGGVDTTPLFVALAGAYLQRTDDVALIDAIWPAVCKAMAWIETYGDSNGDGLIDYQRGAESGLTNQGWKDSEDSVFHADGRLPQGPVALVEVQGYAYAAYRAMAQMAERLAEDDPEVWNRKAEVLRERVEERFWMAEHGYYGIAIDGEGELCATETSNAGHLLFSGLPDMHRAGQVIRRLRSPDFDSGWGLRTVAVGASRYNPMSYHNGSVWPHDTSLCIAGMARYGERLGPVKLLDDLLQASQTFNLRMPELFCGFAREMGEPPIAYPVACVPQAWAAASVFLILQACLGINISAARREVRLIRPMLPMGVEGLTLQGIEIGDARVSLSLRRHEGGVSVTPEAGSDRSIAVVLQS
ncbi:amylo-alpha-1,6-glucosidase [Phenylobacterium montanum]|uniref:Amylo-alpha-1,6-glucosidase n=1 Tax=Phenylobacterium montanum TaxID=2823693 RepID=A0A975G1G5_9CAUL|nr:amylo-alpha-1,6-glucosidase [Caulobacter sp. S6]QUD88822.1 amylo-alpha-1,6-glucosidase [Caulobacter sp. S6]